MTLGRAVLSGRLAASRRVTHRTNSCDEKLKSEQSVKAHNLSFLLAQNSFARSPTTSLERETVSVPFCARRRVIRSRENVARSSARATRRDALKETRARVSKLARVADRRGLPRELARPPGPRPGPRRRRRSRGVARASVAAERSFKGTRSRRLAPAVDARDREASARRERRGHREKTDLRATHAQTRAPGSDPTARAPRSGRARARDVAGRRFRRSGLKAKGETRKKDA